MNFLCFDVSSSGISAALFNFNLECIRFAQSKWNSETLRAETVVSEFERVILQLNVAEPISGLCIGTFMHSCVLMDRADHPLTPLFTWQAQGGEDGIDFVRAH